MYVCMYTVYSIVMWCPTMPPSRPAERAFITCRCVSSATSPPVYEHEIRTGARRALL